MLSADDVSGLNGNDWVHEHRWHWLSSNKSASEGWWLEEATGEIAGSQPG